MANLLIEIGNTAMKAAWTQGSILGKTLRYQGERVMDFIVKNLLSAEKPSLLIIGSVRDISAEDEARLAERCRRLVILDNNHHDLWKAFGLPDYLTPDRVASIMASRDLFKGKSCLIFDFGTTLSIDLLGEDGSYQGGNVSLGCRTRFKALNRYSRTLPLVNTPTENPGIGTSMEKSIEAGVISGIMFEIDGYVGSSPQSVIVFTGGDANYFAKQTKNSIFVVCNLVLMGLASIAEYYESE